MSTKVTVTYQGQSYLYPDGPALPCFYVLPSPDGGVKFHLGLLGPLPAKQDPSIPFNMTAYHVKIENNGAVLLDQDIPEHWWGAEWTFRPVTIIRQPAEIVAANQAFEYGDMGCRIDPPPPPRTPYEYMGASSVTKSMPTSGERGDIGLITNNSARFMLGIDALPMLDWAHAAGSIPNHFRDESTGLPVDLLKFYNATTNTAQNGILLSKGAGGKYGGGWTPQQAHYPELSYIAFMATLNPGFLQDLNHSTTFMFVTDAWLSIIQKKATIYGEYRGVAWALRNLFMVHAATKYAESRGALPEGCHPSSYWKTLLDQQLVYYTNTHMNNPNNQIFRLVIGGNRFSPWMADYMLTALAFGVLTGHSDWVDFYLWALKNSIERTKGGSYQQQCFPPGWGVPYRLNVYEWAKNPDGTWNRDKFDLTKPLNWWTSFEFTQYEVDSKPPTQEQIDALKLDPTNGRKAMQGFGYNQTQRSVLVQAAILDDKKLAPVRAMYPELDACLALANDFVQARGDIVPRQSLVYKGGPPVGKPFEVEVGKSVLLPITWNFNGQPAQKPTGITVTASPDGLVELVLAEDQAEVEVLGLAVGDPLLTVRGLAGEAELVNTAQGKVIPAQLPLANAIFINA